MLSDSPPDRDLDWTEAGITGAWFEWRIVADAAKNLPEPGATSQNTVVRRAIHRAIAGVTEDLEAFHFNRSVARIHELVNVLSNIDPKTDGPSAKD